LEQILLNQKSLDDFNKNENGREMKAEFDTEPKQFLPGKLLITFAMFLPELIFSKKAVFRVFNRINKTESFVNGLQAEAMLGLQSAIREKIKSGLADAFSTESAYVKFEKVEV
jgi:hypothetical protein